MRSCIRIRPAGEGTAVRTERIGTLRIRCPQRQAVPADELIFLTAFAVLLVIHCIGNTSLIYSDAAWMDGMYLLKKGMYVLLLVRIVFFAAYRLDELIVLGIVLLVSAAAFLGGGDDTLLELFLIAAAAKGISPRRLVTWFAVIKGAAMVLTPLLWKLGLLPALYYQNGSGSYNTYGFCHRNVVGANLVILCMAWFWLRYRRLRLSDVIGWTAIGLLSYRLIYSRSCVLVILLISIAVYAFRRTEHVFFRHRSLAGIVGLIFLILLAVSMIGMVFYDPSHSVWSALNTLLTKRLSYANYCFETYGLSLFGQEIPFVSSMQAQTTGEAKLILDNAYCRAVLCWGVLPSLMYFCIYGKLLAGAVRTKNGAALITLLLMAVYGISERYMLDAYYQFPLIIAFGSLFSGNPAVIFGKIGKTRVRFVLGSGKTG